MMIAIIERIHLRTSEFHHGDIVVNRAGCDDSRKRNREDADSLGMIDRQGRSRFYNADHRRDQKAIRSLLMLRKTADDANARRLDAELLVQLAQRGRRGLAAVDRVCRAAGKPDLSGMISEMCGAFDEDDVVRRIREDCQNDRRFSPRHASAFA